MKQNPEMLLDFFFEDIVVKGVLGNRCYLHLTQIYRSKSLEETESEWY